MSDRLSSSGQVDRPAGANGAESGPQNVPQCPDGHEGAAALVTQVPKELSVAQLRAVELLMCGTSATKTAEECKVDRRTVYRWRMEAGPFRDEIERRRSELWTGAADRMRAMIHTSLRVLNDELQDPYRDIRFRAATALLRVANVRKLLDSEMNSRDKT